MRVAPALFVVVLGLIPHVSAGQQLPDAGRKTLQAALTFNQFTDPVVSVPLEVREVPWGNRWVIIGQTRDPKGGMGDLARLLLHQGYLRRGETVPIPNLAGGDPGARTTLLQSTDKFQKLMPWRAPRVDTAGYLGLGLIDKQLVSIDKVELQKPDGSVEFWRVLLTYSSSFVVPEIPRLFPGIKGYAEIAHDRFTEQWKLLQFTQMNRGQDGDAILEAYWGWIRNNPVKWETDVGRTIEQSFGQPSNPPRQSGEQKSSTPAGAGSVSTPGTTPASLPPMNPPAVASLSPSVVARPNVTELARGITNSTYFRESQTSFTEGFDAVWGAVSRTLKRRAGLGRPPDRLQTENRDQGILVTEPTVHPGLLGLNSRDQYVLVVEPIDQQTTQVTVKALCYNQRGQQWTPSSPPDRCSISFIRDLERELSKRH